MALEGDYEPSPVDFVRDQVDLYERTGGREGNTQRDTGLPVIIVGYRGRRSGKVRKAPLMRVEHDGCYALVASKGGAPDHPAWYHNLKAAPDQVTVQDGPDPVDMVVEEVEGAERDEWWRRSVSAFPPYAEYQKKTDRRIPVLVARPKG